MRPDELKQYLELAQQQLSNYTMTHKLLKNELLLLGKAYNNIISDITFKTDTDLFEYKLVTRSVQLLENQKNGETKYSPINSDNEDETSSLRCHENDEESESGISIVDSNRSLHNNIIVVTRDTSYVDETTLDIDVSHNNEDNV